MKLQKLIFFLLNINLFRCLIRELYCGTETCYEVLGVVKNSSKADIARAYRKHVQKIHPDRANSDEERTEFTKKFRRFSTAYEILKDEKIRLDYDKYIEDPTAFYAAYYRYYRRRLCPKIDFKIVLFGLITVATVLQRYIQISNYDSELQDLLSIPKYRYQATNIAKEEISLSSNSKKQKKSRNVAKSQITDSALKKIIADKLAPGAVEIPSLSSLLIIRIAWLPIDLIELVWMQISWFFKHTLRKTPLTDDEKVFLIRRNMGISESKFKKEYGQRIDELLQLALYDKQNWKAWDEEQKLEQERRLMQNGSFKRYHRWMKANAGSQITFDLE